MFQVPPYQKQWKTQLDKHNKISRKEHEAVHANRAGLVMAAGAVGAYKFRHHKVAGGMAAASAASFVAGHHLQKRGVMERKELANKISVDHLEMRKHQGNYHYVQFPYPEGGGKNVKHAYDAYAKTGHRVGTVWYDHTNALTKKKHDGVEANIWVDEAFRRRGASKQMVQGSLKKMPHEKRILSEPMSKEGGGLTKTLGAKPSRRPEEKGYYVAENPYYTRKVNGKTIRVKKGKRHGHLSR